LENAPIITDEEIKKLQEEKYISPEEQASVLKSKLLNNVENDVKDDYNTIDKLKILEKHGHKLKLLKSFINNDDITILKRDYNDKVDKDNVVNTKSMVLNRALMKQLYSLLGIRNPLDFETILSVENIKDNLKEYKKLHTKFKNAGLYNGKVPSDLRSIIVMINNVLGSQFAVKLVANSKHKDIQYYKLAFVDDKLYELYEDIKCKDNITPDVKEEINNVSIQEFLE
jgi:hypothetical protein